MDRIRIGLDFGTHQTKVCVQKTPDEGHGEPNYDFFQFKDLQGRNQYFLPSVIQINEDDTLSYGYVDVSKKKAEQNEPIKQDVKLIEEFDIDEVAANLYNQYATADNEQEDINILADMLKIRLEHIKAENKEKQDEADKIFEDQLKAQKQTRNVFRYFKQATFVDGDWNNNSPISSRILCVWYLAYILFLLEEKYGDSFGLRMGIPADEESYAAKKRLAHVILASAYRLVEDVYHNSLQDFLNEKKDDLLEKTVIVNYSDDLKSFYMMNIFPEAYANLTALTSRGKLAEGMNLTADIGGGTTDISFFTIEKGLPMIYKYWSIPRGLNYVAQRSGFDYSEGNFSGKAQQDVIDKFNRKKYEHIYNLVLDLKKKIREETSIPVQNLTDALKNRILVYSGGGSTFSFLTKPIDTFTDVRVIEPNIWSEENIKDKDVVSKLCQLLTTAYGLSVCEDDEAVKLKSYSTLFSHLPKKYENERPEISKDQC